MPTDRSHPVQSVAAYICTRSWNAMLSGLRVQGPLQAAGLRVVHGNEWDSVSVDAVSAADVVLIQRDFPRFADAYAQVLARARAECKPVIFDTDDLLFELPDDHPAQRSHYYKGALVPTLRAVMQADAVTATTPILCDYLRTFNPNTWLLPNYLDDRYWTIRDEPADPEGRPVILGFIGGESHQSDLRDMLPVFLKLLDRFGTGLVLKFWGTVPPAELLGYPNVQAFQHHDDYPAFARSICKEVCDIFIAPLSQKHFNHYKSHIKFLEYSAFAAPGVYSRITPYDSIVVHGENGYLASSPEEWEQFLAELIANPVRRRAMGKKARQTVREHWLLSEHAHQWADLYERARELARQPRRDLPALSVFDQVARLQRESDLFEMEEALAAKDREIAAVQARLDEVTGSAGWRMVLKLRALRLKAAPYGSRRERMFESLLGKKRS